MPLLFFDFIISLEIVLSKNAGDDGLATSILSNALLSLLCGVKKSDVAFDSTKDCTSNKLLVLLKFL